MEVFGWNEHRRGPSVQVYEALVILRRPGSVKVWVNGSFTTDKATPADVDVLYALGVRLIELHPLFRDERLETKVARKSVYGGDYRAVYEDERALFNLFATDRSDVPKGMVVLSASSISKRVSHDS